MAVKFDKDFVIKHRFWILTGVFVILALVPLFLLVTSVEATVVAARAGYDNAKKAVEGINGSPPNQLFVEAYTKKDKFVADKKAVLHKEAWDAQKDMMTYPEALTPIVKNMVYGTISTSSTWTSSVGQHQVKRRGDGNQTTAAPKD